ncbi:sulfotransferase [Alsobacter sp. SYSU M60028]|uniref:Sulfotransferase n=1 Tax=Alsobacter ponti TaxID=2962936 RepID=A0ABT1LGC0_9HYPH|nr:sulfotransferase [Alsobacter ponti]MCP8939770.1 sulfotransferase [Alsobacter ponti]
MLDDIRQIMGYARLDQLSRYALRVLGRPTARMSDFLFDVPPELTEALSELARGVRGPQARRAVFVHGVLPRSGTNYLADVLALHPELQPDPGRLWEFPLLYVAPGADALQREFQFMFKENAKVMHRHEMMAYLASGWMASLQQRNPDKRLLLKSPHMQGLSLFPAVFPDDIALLVIRDGRDVVESSAKTFGARGPMRKSFAALAREWQLGCEAALSFAEGGPNHHPNIKVVRYEDLVRDTEATVRDLLAHCGLDAVRYDFDALHALPVRGSSASKTDLSKRWQGEQKSASFNPVGRWRDWPEARKRRFNDIAGATLERAGYSLSG